MDRKTERRLADTDGAATTTKGLLAGVKRRLDHKTFIQDVTEPLTGQVDRRRLAQRINNVEHAVSELAEAVEQIEQRAS